MNPENVVQSSSSDTVDYICTECKFKFSRASDFQFQGICFNCGKKSVIIESHQKIVVKKTENLRE